MHPDEQHDRDERQRQHDDYVARLTGRWPQPAAPGTFVKGPMTFAEMMSACTGLSVRCFEHTQLNPKGHEHETQ